MTLPMCAIVHRGTLVDICVYLTRSIEQLIYYNLRVISHNLPVNNYGMTDFYVVSRSRCHPVKRSMLESYFFIRSQKSSMFQDFHVKLQQGALR